MSVSLGLPSKAIALKELTVSLDTVGNSHVAALMLGP
jgi:hypothetical protein